MSWTALHSIGIWLVCVKRMKAITMIGIDLTKSVFKVHGVDPQGRVVCANSGVVS